MLINLRHLINTHKKKHSLQNTSLRIDSSLRILITLYTALKRRDYSNIKTATIATLLFSKKCYKFLT